MKNRILRLAGIGCGARTRTYCALAARMPEKYAVVAGADPVAERVRQVRSTAADPRAFRAFSSAAELLAEEKLADVAIIGTQDRDHLACALRAMERGYDLLLEKPAATAPGDVRLLQRRASELGRRVLVCHVLRYTPLYRTIKQLVDNGVLGRILSAQATEGVGTWHHAHSFVRGHWAVTEESSPMILAKACHDLDILSWLFGEACCAVRSFGGLAFFQAANAPAGAPERCSVECPVETTCAYSALRYLDERRSWLPLIYDRADAAADEEIRQWITRSPWGRCVYRCHNTAVDHQVVAMEFISGATATFTMTAFDKGRRLALFGSRASLRAEYGTGTEPRITVRDHTTGSITQHPIDRGPEKDAYGHGDGDRGLMEALYKEMNHPDPTGMTTSLDASVHSHLIAFAAERSRLERRTVDPRDFASGA
jgi:predicted dehydrogenase